MAANICPICSGEIMKYRRFQKDVEASRVSVCQCCGARLRRRPGAAVILAALILGVSGILVLAASRLIRLADPSPGTVVLLLMLCAASGVVLYGLGKRLLGWVPLDGTRLGSPGQGLSLGKQG